MINKESVRSHDATITELIPGRALLLTLKWHNEYKLMILNIYAPNAHHEHPDFWRKIKQKLTDLGNHSIDIMLGDFNIVEDQFNRSPPRPDDYTATEALRNFKEQFQIIDVWRHDNPNMRSFTFISNTHSMSRLDHIYTNCTISKSTYNWNITDTIIPSDHRMVLTRIVPPKTPYIGPGRWTLPLALLTNESFLDNVTELGIILQNQLTQPHEEPKEPQRLWSTFKKEISEIAERTAKRQLAKMNNKIIALKQDIRELEQNNELDTNENQQSNVALLQHEIRHLENKKNKNM